MSAVKRTEEKGFFGTLISGVVYVVLQMLWHLRWVLRRALYCVKIPSMGGLSLYRIVSLYIRGLIQGTLAARAESIAYSFFMALFPAVVFIFSIIAYIPIDGLQETLMGLIEEGLPPTTW
ncbi:MAG: hypothetical protein PHD21_03255, partial [Flavobacteriales bacterium]|nr:hypothetical protein [Flavobacteriales bacterium]